MSICTKRWGYRKARATKIFMELPLEAVQGLREKCLDDLGITKDPGANHEVFQLEMGDDTGATSTVYVWFADLVVYFGHEVGEYER